MSEPLFLPFRALGYITDDVPFAVQKRGKENFVTVSVGKTWQIYDCAKLTLKMVGPQMPHAISALACKGDFTFAAVKNTIVACRRAHRVGVFRGHEGGIVQLLVLGDRLLSLGRDGRLLVWKLDEYDSPQVMLQFHAGFRPTCFAHPDTYLNKVVVGGAEGKLQLWNFQTATCLHTFTIAECGVSCLAVSPALDVVGIGLADGRAVLYNLRYGEEVMQFSHASGVGAEAEALAPGAQPSRSSAGGGPCTALAFRTGAGTPLMAAGGGAGAITVWDLERRRLATVLRDAHDAPLASVHFFKDEARLMSSAGDNAVKQWAFDAADGSGRLLRFRSGHAAPAGVVRHYGDGTRLLSAGRDRAFRMFSVIQDQQSRELSQGHIGKRAKRMRIDEADLKLPPLTSLAARQIRERDWCNVITGHEGDPAAYLWRLQHFTLGDAVLLPRSKAERGPVATSLGPVTAVTLSHCGNFGVVGSASGRVDRYNVQSGQHRGYYNRGDGKGATACNAHDGAVTGLAVDGMNHVMATAGHDGHLRMWDFRKGKLLRDIDVTSPVTHLAHHPSSGLIAVASADLVLRMYDMEAGRLVRQFRGHQDRITDMVISEDGRWLLSASLDGTLRVWDIPSARTLQVLRLGSTVVSLSLGPSGDLLATLHAGRRGIYLWSNQLLFGGAADILPSEKPVDARLPNLATGRGASDADPDAGALVLDEGDDNSDAGQGSDASGSDTDSSDADADEAPRPGDAAAAAAGLPARYARRDGAGAPTPLAPRLVTLSLLPRTQWQSLMHLDEIKERNKPIQPPKKPEAAPFFLPTVAGLQKNVQFDVPATATADPFAARPDPFAPRPGADGNAPASAALRGRHPHPDPFAPRLAADADANGPSGEGPDDADAVRGRKAARAKRGGRALAEHAEDAPSEFVALLRRGAVSREWSPLAARLRAMPPSALDLELRTMQVVEGMADEEEIHDIGLLLEFISAELDAGRNFEFIQAVLAVALKVHADIIMARPELRAKAADVERRLSATWHRLDDLLQGVRCMVDFFGNLQT